MSTNVISQITLNISEAGIVALLGYAVVFFGLILLMYVVKALGKVLTNTKVVKETEIDNEVASDELPLEVMMMAAAVLMNNQDK